ncbi:MAG: xanthine dehydrogenase family protein molybdopterin-binding subunit [Planctomycetota bacterium]|nr:xanthine dehydrogenase family protein molybdopterin-binding subunit [Planctomycetota bacterium]MDG2143043.1 xanthine dehydrogenase family protein molybdopterin-binding subunit [Planctomycetota bacterium]
MVSQDKDGIAWPLPDRRRAIGKDTKRIDGPVKVTGAARYSHDVRLPGMVYARFVTCTMPKAEVELDFEAALAVPGVVHAKRTCGDTTLYLGEPIAVVAAETPEAAAEGARAVVVKLTELGWVLDSKQALADGAPAVSRRGNIGRERTKTEGDVDAGFAASDQVIEATYTIPTQHHSCLETHGMVVDYRGGDSAVIYGSIQGTFALLDGPPETLGLDMSMVEGDVQHMGGGFGSKFGVGIEGRVACELAKELERPVHLLMDRETEFLASGNRSGNEVSLKAGISKDGVVQAFVSDSNKLGGLSGGSYASMPFVYTVANFSSTTRSVYTNLDGNRAFRAPGYPQASFGMEGMMDELAYSIGMDIVEMRLANLPKDDWNGVWRRQLRRVADEIGWNEHPHKGAPGPHSIKDGNEYVEGIGFGLAVWGGGGYPTCEVECRVDPGGSLTVSIGTQDLGTGSRTLVAMVAADEFGLEVGQVTARIGNTKYGRGNMSGGSTTTACMTPAVKDATFKMSAKLLDLVASNTGKDAAKLSFGDGGAVVGEGLNIGWKDVCDLAGASGVTTHGKFRSELQASGVHGAQAARVRVDLVTGEVKVLNMICMQDMGLALNPMAVRSQIQGAMVQAVSYALFEERLVDADLGIALNPNFESYRLANAQSIPEMTVIIDDEDDRGVIGVGEPPAIPGIGAIAGAIHNACGVRVRDMPLSSSKILMGLEELRNA